MSHWSTDLLADRVIDDVADMTDDQVSQQLLKAGKGTQFLVGPLADMDKARDTLMDLLFESALEIQSKGDLEMPAKALGGGTG